MAKTLGEKLSQNLRSQWSDIWNKINYISIFQIAESVLIELPATAQTQAALSGLAEEAIEICSQQTALRHDLMGRIYHWLLHYAKYLGAYFTSVSAATLLMKMVMALPWKVPFNEETLKNFKVADLACGTGTLLMASCQAILDELIRTRYQSGLSLEPADIQQFHKILMENTIYGYDVLPSAVHLTASTLALLAPEVAFVGMNLYVMPMGIDHKLKQLGSLEFIRGDETQTQISLDYSQTEPIKTSASGAKAVNAKVPKADLFVMNPPFARSVGDNLLFGSLPDERAALQTELKKLVKQYHLSASIVAGLGSVFVATANKHIADGGRLAIILPHALVSGEAWAPTRQLIADQYHLETVIVSYDATRFNFSENTSISEVMFIARKREKKVAAEKVRYISLSRNPRSIHEALDVAGRINRTKNVTSLSAATRTIVTNGSTKIAEVVDAPLPDGDGNWTGALYSQFNLFKIVHEFHSSGTLRLPGSTKSVTIPLCKLQELGDLGPDRKRISEGFRPSQHELSSCKGFFGHKSGKVTTVAQTPNTNLVVRADSPRGPNYGDHLWERSGTILIAERIRFNTHRVLSIGFKVPVLGNTWWALKTTLHLKQRKALLLWLNSSLSILEFFSRRVVTQGAFVQMKQPAWQKMLVLDVRSLGSDELNALAAAYDKLADATLMPLSKLAADPNRARVDFEVSQALNLPDLGSLRELLALEPGLGVASEESELEEDEEDDEEDES